MTISLWIKAVNISRNIFETVELFAEELMLFRPGTLVKYASNSFEKKVNGL